MATSFKGLNSSLVNSDCKPWQVHPGDVIIVVAEGQVAEMGPFAQFFLPEKFG